MTDSEKLERIRNYCEEMIPEAKEEGTDYGQGMILGLKAVLEIMDGRPPVGTVAKRPEVSEKKIGNQAEAK